MLINSLFFSLSSWYYYSESNVLQYFDTYKFAVCQSWLKQFKPCKVPTVIGCIMQVGVLIYEYET